MTKYKAVEKAIQEANSDIMELQFGCEIEITDYDDKYGQDYPLEQTIIYEIDGVYKTTVGDLEYDFKILGKPITLENVLIATGQVDKELTIKEYLATNNRFCIQADDKKCYWKLGLPLSQQSKELHEFLWDLLVKK